nr:hypothetical protein [uncultured Chitinophaga sp.]
MDKNLKIALILSATDKATAVLGRAFKAAERHAKSFEKSGKAISEIGDKSLIAGGAVTAFFAKSVHDARESVKATARLEQVFKSMGEASNKAAEDAADFASQLQFRIGLEDEEIMAVQAKLATFKRASDEAARSSGVFNRATAAAFDLQAAGFGDALSNVVQLGKALQNPALGATALAKAGAINKEDLPAIKFLQAAKGIPAAQQFLLKAVERQVKGVAEATADPTERMRIQFTESSEAIGKALLPSVNRLANKMAIYAPKIVAFAETHKPLIIMVAKAGIGLLAFGASMKVVGFAVSGIGTLFKVAGSAIKATSFLINNGSKIAIFAVKGYDALKFGLFALQYGMKFTVIPALRSAGMAFVRFGAMLLANPITLYIAAAVALAAVVFLIIRNWDKIKAFFSRLWQGIKEVFTKFWGWAKWYFLNLTPYGLIIKHWSKIVALFRVVWDGVKHVFTETWNWIANLGAKFYDAGKNIVLAIARGIWAVSTAPLKGIMWIVKKIRNHLPFSPAKEGPLRDIHRIKLIETIAQGINPKPLYDSIRNVTGGVYNQLNRPLPIMAGAGGGSSAFNITVNMNGGTRKDADDISDTIKQQLEKWWRSKQHNDNRISFTT